VTAAALRPAARARHDRIIASLGTLPPTSARPAVVIVSGLPGAGKSTFSRRLAPLIDAVILESDALRAMLFGPPTYSTEESAALFRSIHRAAATLLSQGHSVLIDATSLREKHRRPIVKLALAAGAALFHVRLTAPEDVILRRLEERPHRSDGFDHSDAGVEVYLRMKEELEPVLSPHRLVDSTDDAAYYAALHEIADAYLALRYGVAETKVGSTGGRP
jgi:predicted kinase